MKKANRDFVCQALPMIVDARISRSVLTLPYRRIHYGQTIMASARMKMKDEG